MPDQPPVPHQVGCHLSTVYCNAHQLPHHDWHENTPGCLGCTCQPTPPVSAGQEAEKLCVHCLGNLKIRQDAGAKAVGCDHLYYPDYCAVCQRITTALSQAVAGERERCAKVAEQYEQYDDTEMSDAYCAGGQEVAKLIAATLRPTPERRG